MTITYESFLEDVGDMYPARLKVSELLNHPDVRQISAATLSKWVALDCKKMISQDLIRRYKCKGDASVAWERVFDLANAISHNLKNKSQSLVEIIEEIRNFHELNNENNDWSRLEPAEKKARKRSLNGIVDKAESEYALDKVESLHDLQRIVISLTQSMHDFEILNLVDNILNRKSESL